MDKINVLNGGFVRLAQCSADDLSVVNSARVSFGKIKDQLDEGDKGLINFLMREKHGTPFEHNFFSFHVKAPIFVAREWFRHRIGWSYNEYSARYSVMPQNWYVPEVDSVRTQVGKPGSYSFDQLDQTQGSEMRDVIDNVCGQAYRTYNYLLENGVAKELARSVLPVGMYTEFYATTNARGLMNFVNLRAAETAQYEIRVYANALETFLMQQMPVTYEAFTRNERVAP